MTSEIRANTLKNRVGLGTVSLTNTGPVVSGIVTANGLELNSVDTGSSADPEIKLYRNSASPADADYLGQIKFAGESDTGVERNYAKITGKILDASNGTEDGILEFAHIKGGSQNISARFRSDSLQLLNGTSLTVAGTSDFTGNATFSGNVGIGTDTGNGLINTRQGGTNSQVFHFRADLGSSNGRSLNLYTPDTDNTNAPFRFQTGNGYLFQCDGANVFTIAHDRRVGINSTAPSNTLVVREETDNNPSIQLFRPSTGGDIANIIWATNQGNQASINYRGGGGSEGLQFYTGGTGSSNLRAIIDTSGNVGIGTDNPSTYKLHLQGSTSALARFERTGGAFAKVDIKAGSSSGNSYLTFSDSDNSEVAAINYEHADDSLRIETWDGDSKEERLRITTDGKLGISINNPTKKLHINTTGTSGEGIILKATDSTYPSFIGDANRSATDLFLVALQGYWNGNRVGEVTVESGSDTTNKDEGMVRIRTRNDGDSSPQDRFTVYHTGQVEVHSTTQSTLTTNGALKVGGGIGVAKNIICGGTLEVQNNSLIVTSATPNILMAVPSGGLDSRIYNDGSGNFIIGHGTNSSNPTERLRIGSTGVVHVNSVTNGQAVIAFGNPSGHSHQEQNRIGGDTIYVADESISSAIYMPRQGCFVIITAYSDSTGIYPQPNTSCIAYVDCGASRNIRICDLGTGVGTAVAAKNAYTSNVSDCDNNKLTIMAGDTQGTFRLVNRESNNDYYYQITFL